MDGLHLGIDVGGTHTDGVAVNLREGKVVRKVKSQTTPDLRQCSMEALEKLLAGLPASSVSRVVISTTLVTNAVATKRLEPAGLIIMSGPGMNPSFMTSQPYCHLAMGAMDHRGREIIPIDPREIDRILENLSFKGISVVAVAGKFAGRNPSHELAIGALADRLFDHVALAHRLSGSLNFPRRVATAHLSASLWRRQREFVSSLSASGREHSIEAPLYLLGANGGAALAGSFHNAAETALSGPAASIMGVMALDSLEGETIALDVGGTTTDISLFVGAVPLLEPHGATIGDYKTQIRSLFNRSAAIGGDSEVKCVKGRLAIGPLRKGPAKSLGGPEPTPTDAMILLGLTEGDRAAAREALAGLASALSKSPEECAKAILREMGATIASALAEFVAEVNKKPVYTIKELLAGHKVSPRRAVLVGGPARAIEKYVEEALGIPVLVPPHFEVANAIGAAVAGVNLEVNGLADTAIGSLSIPEAGVYREVQKSYSMAQLHAECFDSIKKLALEMGLTESDFEPDVVESESFNII
ncbi:hydantoinase/oxoprolinase family protein, partial [bacterium]